MSDAKGGDIIIKRVKKVAGGHHGGAWKVAYADFVTAMMAFFLLLWLLSTTTPEQRQGIAEYFTPTLGLRDAKGIGFEGGLTPNEKGSSKSTLTQPGIVAGQIQQGKTPSPPSEMKEVQNTEDTESGTPGSVVSQETTPDPSAVNDANPKGSQADDDTFKQAAHEITNAFEQSPELKQLSDNVIITNTPEGLKIDLVDDKDRPMFQPGNSTLTDNGRLMLKAVGSIVLKTPNHLSIIGHTDATPPSNAATSNWELSSDRANASRKFLSEGVVEPERVKRISGMANRELLLPNEPNNPRNRRVTLIMLRDSHMLDSEKTPQGKALLSVSDVDAKSILRAASDEAAAKLKKQAKKAPAATAEAPATSSIFDNVTANPEPANDGSAPQGKGLISVPELDMKAILRAPAPKAAPAEPAPTAPKAAPQPQREAPKAPSMFDNITAAPDPSQGSGTSTGGDILTVPQKR